VPETFTEPGPTAPAKRKRKPRRTPPEQRRAWVDQRTRVARRQRAIERDLRASLQRQGRVITVHDDCLIGSLASCLLQTEIMAGERSRGARVDLEQTTRLANASQRLVAALGLKPEVLRPKPPRLEEYLERAHGEDDDDGEDDRT
jgi:hypothetical protein